MQGIKSLPLKGKPFKRRFDLSLGSLTQKAGSCKLHDPVYCFFCCVCYQALRGGRSAAVAAVWLCGGKAYRRGDLFSYFFYGHAVVLGNELKRPFRRCNVKFHIFFPFLWLWLNKNVHRSC